MTKKAQEHLEKWLPKELIHDLVPTIVRKTSKNEREIRETAIRLFNNLPFNSQFGWKIAWMRELGYDNIEEYIGYSNKVGYRVRYLTDHKNTLMLARECKTPEEAFNNLVEAVGNKQFGE